MEPQMPVTSPFDTPMPSSQQPTVPPVVVTPPSHTPPPAPTFSLKMEPEKDMSMTTTTTVQTVDTPRKRGLGYPFLGLITIIAGIVLAAQQYGLGNLIPYPLSGLIAAGIVILIGLRLLARGWLGRLLAFWLGLAILVVVGAMIYDTVYPGTLPRTGSRGIIVSYDKTGNNLTLNLGTIPFSGSDEVITPPTPLDDTIIHPSVDDTTDNGGGGDNGLSGYTITVTGSNNSGAKK